MPELPEVETIRRHLAPRVEGRRLGAVEVLDPRWTDPLHPDEAAARLSGRTIERLGRRGKYLLWELEGDLVLAQHLRMTGTVLYDPQDEPPHTRVRLPLDDGHSLVVVDPRRFGTGHLLEGERGRDTYFDARLGLEPLDARFTPDHLRAMTRRSRAPIKPFVLDQKRIAGVGNIYADEALFRAGIHPLRQTDTLRRAQTDALHEALRDVLRDGIDARGASIDDFRDPEGVQGSFQDAFRVHLRAGEPCPRCGSAVRKLVVGGRGTYVCERCQPRPRARRATPRP
ncbi:MAG TPA: bifunctional DNA-formamidopyrimidine glycosylase/DNA-(apurinic or apyrimidinic site) lyase [Solirubrobacteraceae bacterium]